MMTSRSARRMAALALFPISLLVATDAAALTYVAGTVPIATAFGQCNEQPDVVWFSGEYVVSYVSRSCPVIGNGDANAELVRVPLGAMPIPVRRLLVDGRTFPDAFVRLGTNGAEALTIVVGRKGLAEWTIHRINAAPGLMNLALATSRVVGPEYDRFEFDCWGGGCGLVGRRRRVDMAYDILHLGIDGDAITPVFFAIREPWISALQVNNERQVLYTNSPVAPRVRRFNLDTGATTPLPPPGVVNVVSVAGARYQNTFVSYSAEQGGAIFRHIEGAADRAPENFTGEFLITDVEARGQVVNLVSVVTTIGPLTEYHLMEQPPGQALRSLVAFGGAHRRQGAIRMALERGRNHSGSGMMVFERDRAGGNGTDIVATRLQCSTNFDCDDGDLVTPDRCVAEGARYVCDRTPVVPDGGFSPDASIDVIDVPNLRDVPSRPDAANAVDVPSAQEGSVADAATALDGETVDTGVTLDVPTVMDVSASPFEDSTQPRTDSQAVPQDNGVVEERPIAFGGGSCGCRTTGAGRTTPLIWLSFASLVLLGASGRRRRRIQRS